MAELDLDMSSFGCAIKLFGANHVSLLGLISQTNLEQGVILNDGSRQR